MKKDDKKALYESIMSSVAREVKKALNEGIYTTTGFAIPWSDTCIELWNGEDGDPSPIEFTERIVEEIYERTGENSYSDEFVDAIFVEFPDVTEIAHCTVKNNEENEPFNYIDRYEREKGWQEWY